ncbi:amidohydrolase family protein [Qipengyuania sp. RANM35]|uniref:amidohydrolase family protein n=1 Tax=Qipengyuania sp. RANM35 TaxID=3068635 RepID=UPI0034DB15F7
MRKFLAASLLAFTVTTSLSTAALAEPAKKEDLMVAPDGARHFTITSSGGKHGDIWAWETAEGATAYRMSMNLRGWITETDQTIVNGPDGTPVKIDIRGFTDTGDASETFFVDADGIAHWKSSVDEGHAHIEGKRYSSYGGPWLAGEQDLAALLAAGSNGIDLLPSGHAVARVSDEAQVEGPNGTETVKLAFVTGYGFSPSPFWIRADGSFFGFAGGMSLLPAGYEANALKLKDISDKATAAMVKEVANSFLTPANKTPTLVDNVTVFDSLAGTYLTGRSVLIADGKIAKVGAAGTVKASKLATVIDGKGKTLVPGLWDAHRHTGGDDWNLLQNVATGMTNYRSPGSEIDETISLVTRRAAGELLAPEGETSIIVDRKDPLAAQGSITVSSLDEAIAAVHKIKDAGMWGVKFYTSMTPAWIAPAAAEAHKLGLHVHGHIPAGMRPLEAVRAGYDEVTHINFIMMQAMPQEVVDKSNTAARLEGPAKYGKDVDLSSPEMMEFYKELGERGTYIDPTLTVWEPLMTSDGSELAPEYAPFAKVAPPGVARSWKISGYPLFDGLTRDDFRKSFDKMVQLVGKLHKAGAPIVAGTDGWGLELVRELELYEDAGLTNAEALQTATIIPARLTGMDKDFGSVTEGKVANLVLVDGDVSQDIGKLRKVETVFLDGYRLSGDALRKASGLSGMPE